MKAVLAVLILLALAVLTACQPQLVRTEVVTVQSTVFVPIKSELTVHGKIPLAKGQTCGDAVETARERKDLLAAAYQKLDAIAGIQGTIQSKTVLAPVACPVLPEGKPHK